MTANGSQRPTAEPAAPAGSQPSSGSADALSPSHCRSTQELVNTVAVIGYVNGRYEAILEAKATRDRKEAGRVRFAANYPEPRCSSDDALEVLIAHLRASKAAGVDFPQAWPAARRKALQHVTASYEKVGWVSAWGDPFVKREIARAYTNSGERLVTVEQLAGLG